MKVTKRNVWLRFMGNLVEIPVGTPLTGKTSMGDTEYNLVDSFYWTKNSLLLHDAEHYGVNITPEDVTTLRSLVASMLEDIFLDGEKLHYLFKEDTSHRIYPTDEGAIKGALGIDEEDNLGLEKHELIKFLVENYKRIADNTIFEPKHD